MASALQGVLRSVPASEKIWESLAFAYWPAIVGKAAAKATDLECIIDGTLQVRTNTSVWSHELNMMKAHLIAQLNDTIGRAVIKDIRFKVKKLIKVDALVPEPDKEEF